MKWRGRLICLLVVLFSCPPFASGQSGDGIDLAVSSLFAPSPLILDEENAITANVQNRGLTPVRGLVSFFASNATLPDVLLGQETTTLLEPGEVWTAEIRWNGREDSGPQSQPMRGSVEIRVNVEPADLPGPDDDPSNDVASVLRELVIHELRLQTSASSPNDALPPAERGWFEVHVTNHGNVDDEAQLTVTTSTAGWNFTLSEDRVPLPLSEPERVVFVYYEAGAQVPALQRGTAILRAAPAGTIAGEAEASLLTRPVAPAGSLRLEVPAPSSVRPSASVGVAVRVVSEQNFDQNVVLRVTPIGEAAELETQIEPAQAHLAPFDSTSLTVTVTASPAALARTHEWKVSLAALGPGAEEIVADRPLQISVEQEFRVAIEALDPQATIQAGLLQDVRFRLRNDGNGPDRVRIIPVTLPPGWTLRVPPGEPSHLEPNTSVEQAAELFAPANTAAGPYNLRLRAVSESGGIGDCWMTVDVLRRPFPTLHLDRSVLPLDSSQPVSIQATVRNDGNTAGPLILGVEVDASRTRPGPHLWNVTASPVTFQLAPGSQTNASITLRPPGNLGPRDRIHFNVTLASADYGELSMVELVRAFPPFPDLEIERLATMPDPPYVDAPTTLSFTITNNGTESTGTPFNVTIKSMAAGIPERTTTLQVAAMDWREGLNRVNLSLPLPTTADALGVRVDVDSGQVVPEIDEANNILDTNLTFARFGIKVTPPRGLPVRPSEILALEGPAAFRIENTGRQAEALRITLRSNPPRLLEQSLSATLAPGSSRSFPVTILIPPEPMAPRLQVEMLVFHETVNLSRSGVAVFPIVDSMPPAIQALRSSVPIGTVAQAARFTAKITDPLGIEEVHVVITDPRGAVTENVMEPTSAQNEFGADFVPTRPGIHRVHVWARDGSLQRNTNTTSSFPLLFLVQPSHAIALNVVRPGANESLCPGREILVDVVGPQSLIGANYTRGDGNTHELPPGGMLEISTADWPEGLHQVAVAVQDAEGASAYKMFNVTIDATPPRILTEPTIRLPGDNLLVRARVEDESTISWVRLRISQSDAALELSMEETDGFFIATIPGATAVDSILVLAQDSAGNEGFADATVSTSKGVNPTRNVPAFDVSVFALATLIGIAMTATLSRGRLR